MTYKTRYEVFEAAAAWMRVCEKAGVVANVKHFGMIFPIEKIGFNDIPESYEFPLALLEGKDVWRGESELYDESGRKYVVSKDSFAAWGRKSTWNPPKHKTVMVEVPVKIAEYYAKYDYANQLGHACKKALEKL